MGVYSTLLSVFVSLECLSSMLWVGFEPTVQLFRGLLWFHPLQLPTLSPQPLRPCQNQYHISSNNFFTASNMSKNILKIICKDNAIFQNSKTFFNFFLLSHRSESNRHQVVPNHLGSPLPHYAIVFNCKGNQKIYTTKFFLHFFIIKKPPKVFCASEVWNIYLD